MKKRGRPLGSVTLERRRIEKLMRELPEHIPRLTVEEKAKLEEVFKHNEEVRVEILKTYKHGSWTPDEHAYSMASLGDESFEGHEQKVLDDDSEYRRQAKKIRANAGAENIKKSQLRQEKVMKINKALIEKINSTQTYSLHRVASLIHEQWKSMKPAQRLTNEAKNMNCRGDGNEPVSIRTITRWIESHLATFDKPRI